LRFPGFEEEWEQITLGDCSISLDYGMNAAAKSFDGINKYIRITDIDENTLRYKSENPVSPSGNIDDKYLVGENDILFARTGASTGKSYLYHFSDGKLYFAGFLIRAKIKNEYNSKFIFSQFQTKKYDKWVELMSMRSGQPGINSQEYSSFILFLPSVKKEQDKIASFISLIDERIETQSKIIEQLETLIQNCCNQIFKQKIRFKGKDGIDFSEWTEVKIGDILKIGNGKDYKHLKSGKVPVFGTGGFMTLVDNFLYDGETVCIGRKGTIDKPMYHEGKIWTVDTLFYTHSFQSCIPKFIFYLFQTINWLEYNEASGVPSLSKSTIEKIKIEIPSINEQKQIASFLSKIEQKIETEKQFLEQLEKQKKYLLHQMFV
jgi:type I restriction enzyme S subunit